MTKSQKAGLVIAGLTLLAAALVIPEVRVALGLEEPHKVASTEERSPKFEIVGADKIRATSAYRFRSNGQLGIRCYLVIRNVGGSVSEKSKVRIFSPTLDHSKKKDFEFDNGFSSKTIDQRFDGLTPNEGRRIYFTYWLDKEIKTLPIGKHPFKIVIFSGSGGSVQSELKFTVSLDPSLEIEETG